MASNEDTVKEVVLTNGKQLTAINEDYTSTIDPGTPIIVNNDQSSSSPANPGSKPNEDILLPSSQRRNSKQSDSPVPPNSQRRNSKQSDNPVPPNSSRRNSKQSDPEVPNSPRRNSKQSESPTLPNSQRRNSEQSEDSNSQKRNSKQSESPVLPNSQRRNSKQSDDPVNPKSRSRNSKQSEDLNSQRRSSKQQESPKDFDLEENALTILPRVNNVLSPSDTSFEEIVLCDPPLANRKPSKSAIKRFKANNKQDETTKSSLKKSPLLAGLSGIKQKFSSVRFSSILDIHIPSETHPQSDEPSYAVSIEGNEPPYDFDQQYGRLPRPTMAAPQPRTRIYKTRWYILAVFTAYVAMQYFIWNSFGPIASSVKTAYGWENSDITLLASWDTILYVIFSLEVCWLVQKRGLRKSFLCSLFLVVIGALFRCFAVRETKVKTYMNTGQILNGLGGMLAQAAGPVVSSNWFPPDERTRATAISTLASQGGLALSYIIGPAIVKEEAHIRESFPNITTRALEAELRDEISTFMYKELLVTCFITACAMLYFPNKPKLPPSLSASLTKLQFRDGFKRLFKMRNYWYILFIAASSTGIYSGWAAVLYLNLSDHGLGITQSECGLMGFASTVFSAIGGIALGYLSDKWPGHMRHLLIILFSLAFIMFCWITVICLKVFTYRLDMLYIPCLIGGFCINGSTPLMYEMIIELTYPIPETVSIGFLGVVNNIFTFAFLLLFNVPKIGVVWTNWCLIATCFICLLLLTRFKEKYYRMKIDGISVTSIERRVESTIERRLHGINSMAPTAKRFISDMRGIAVVSFSSDDIITSPNLEPTPNRSYSY
ncbi:solute carrier family 49 member 4 homolog [Clytia hemisphaerica]|uniref:Uncharacterized protein n=1 Tax=Clytia hemisphaerica TaxID=252671 RepID=A0A7M5WZ45_9CNID|eukprot:TCONS_00000396-protein